MATKKATKKTLRRKTMKQTKGGGTAVEYGLKKDGSGVRTTIVEGEGTHAAVGTLAPLPLAKDKSVVK